MLEEIKLTAQEIEQIVLSNTTDRLLIKSQLERLKTLMPKQAIAYTPSGKTNLVSIIVMGLGLIPGLLFAFLFNLGFLFLLQFPAVVLVLILRPLQIDKVFIVLFLLLFIFLRGLYPYDILTKRIGCLIAYLSKNSNNRNFIVPAVIAAIPSLLLSIVSIYLFFKALSGESYEFSGYVSLLAIFIFIAVVSGVSACKTFYFVNKEIYQQKFSEKNRKFYQHYHSRKYVAHLAPYLKYLAINKAYNDQELQQIIEGAFEGYKNFVVINVYKFSNNESYDKGYVDMELNFKFKRTLGSVEEKWYFFSREMPKAELENFVAYLKIQ